MAIRTIREYGDEVLTRVCKEVKESTPRIKELVNDMFDTMYEAQVLTQRWVRYYNQVRPHSSLGGRPPAPQTVVPIAA